MIEKRPLVPSRLRYPPREGFSWVDRRFLRDFAPRLSGEAILLYFFFCAVSDKHGLSYWGDAAICARLRLGDLALLRARDELVDHGLIAHEPPLVQVLALPRGQTGGRPGGAALLRDIVRKIEGGEP